MKRSRLDYTYISKLENNAASYPPSDKVLGQLAEALDLEQADLTILAGRFPRSIQAAVIRLYQQHGDRLLPMLLELEQEVRL
jgi:transcriptional regulator with XRE-family HTH domain